MAQDYYQDKLSSNKLKKCYDIAPQRVRQYLEAEVEHLKDNILPGDRALELGCGYGRILPQIAAKAGFVVGIDNSPFSIALGRDLLRRISNCRLVLMNAAQLAFREGGFDVTACIQNGISAFKVDPRRLISEAVRVTRPGGKALFSSYSDRFWEQRLKWFELQSAAGLLGEIDYDKTGCGVIECKDGFKATAVNPEQFLALAEPLNLRCEITEVDESSVFCEIFV